jgi:hypothetical protein
MQRLGEDHHLFPYSLSHEELRSQCAKALVQEFCLPFGRRQSLEALGLVAADIDLGRFFRVPDALGTLLPLDKQDLLWLIQELLVTVRLQKAVDLPSPLSFKDPAFAPRLNKEGFVSCGGTTGPGYQIHSYLPARATSRQRRAGFVKRVLEQLGHPITNELVLQILHEVWLALTETDAPAGTQPLARVELAPGQMAFQLRWAALRFSIPKAWYVCTSCRQWTTRNILGACPSFACTGTLTAADPDRVLGEHHYRTLYRSARPPVPLTAKEHTAQISPALATAYQEAFQEGHSRDQGQINVLSCSTTFELGVDLGDLEAVLLRGIPPGPANYQQRAGRAGRGIGTAAFVVSFAQPRSHDQHYYESPEEIIRGNILPPRLSLTNEIVLRRHLNAVLLADFVRTHSTRMHTIGAFLEGGTPTLCDRYLELLPELVSRLHRQIAELASALPASYVEGVPARAAADIERGREYYFDEKQMYETALVKVGENRERLEREGKPTQRVAGYMDYLRRRLSDLANVVDWVSFLADRNILPGYAFPIHNVSLECSDTELRLERDLRIALAEYVPGAKVVAKARLWESRGVRLPPQRTLEQKWYARCPKCWHVQRHLNKDFLFRDANGACPVCGDTGLSPVRRKHMYVVPAYGFTTDTTQQGQPISFDRPFSIPASRVLFVPQQEEEAAPDLTYGESGAVWVAVRTTETADFFVFNDGPDGNGLGFSLCDSCGVMTESKPSKTKTRHGAHLTPRGTECHGKSSWKHLGHEFRGSACRLVFHGTGHDFTGHGFWLSLMYGLLNGMSDALDIERHDIDGVIRSVRVGATPAQEIVLFDNVPGGAGHVNRLRNEEDLLAVVKAAYNRVAYCSCGDDVSCYKCLRGFGNQFCHDILNRGIVTAYLQHFLASVK